MGRVGRWYSGLVLTVALTSCGESPTALTSAVGEITSVQVQLDGSVDARIHSRIVTVASAVDARPFKLPQTALAVPSGREPVLVVGLDANGDPVLEALSVSGETVVLSYESTARSLVYSVAQSGVEAEASLAPTIAQLAANVQASASRGVSYYEDEAVRESLIELSLRGGPVIARMDVVGFDRLSVDAGGAGAVSITNRSLVAFTAGALGQSILVPANGSVDITGLTDPSHSLTLSLQGPAIIPNGLNLTAITIDFLVSAAGIAGAGSGEFRSCLLATLTQSITQLLADAVNDVTVDIPTEVGKLILKSRGPVTICFKDYLENHLNGALWGTALKRMALVTAVWDAGRFAIENGPFLLDFADAVADSPFAMILCRRADGTYVATAESTCPGPFTGNWAGSYSFGPMSAVLEQTGTSVQGQITDAAGCVWSVTGTASGDNLALPSWTLLVPVAQICVGASVTLQGTLDASGTTISGQGVTIVGSVFPWTFSWARQ